jgi:glycosyltransferase involved in cell wall biosynthesis
MNAGDKAIDVVSVVVPVYNCAGTLARCFESIRSQTYNRLEVLLIDDGSTDDSAEICRSYVVRDDRFQVIQTLNGGPAAARNTGIANASGRFLCFVDADDYLAPDAIELLVNGQLRHGADLVAGDFEIIGGNSNYGLNAPFREDRALDKRELATYIRNYLKKPTGHSFFVYVWAKLFRSDIIRRERIRFRADLSRV